MNGLKDFHQKKKTGRARGTVRDEEREGEREFSLKVNRVADVDISSSMISIYILPQLSSFD